MAPPAQRLSPGTAARMGLSCVYREWDDSYTYNFNSMFQEGMCIKQVRTDIVNGDFSGCDVRVFNQFAYIFNNDFKQGNITSRAEDNVFHPPPKLSPDVVDFYYAHESPDHYGYELRGDTEYSRNRWGIWNIWHGSAATSIRRCNRASGTHSGRQLAR